MLSPRPDGHAGGGGRSRQTIQATTMAALARQAGAVLARRGYATAAAPRGASAAAYMQVALQWPPAQALRTKC